MATNVVNEVNTMLYEMFLVETEMRECRWVLERLVAGDRISVRAFLRRIHGTITNAEEDRMVTRVIRDPSILACNHTRF